MLLFKYPIYNLKICFSATEQFSLIVQLAQKMSVYLSRFLTPTPQTIHRRPNLPFLNYRSLVDAWRLVIPITQKNHEKVLRVASKYKGMGLDT